MNDMQDASELEAALIENALRGKHPLNASFELLPLCNLNCRMCFVRLSRREMENKGGLLSGDEWYSLAEKLKKAGTLFLLLTGGEPLMHPDFRELYVRLRKLGFIITVNTNGTLIDESYAGLFAENKPRRVNITLYGAGPDTYEKLCGNGDSYYDVINAIKLLRKKDVDVKINYSATGDNAAEVDRVFSLCEELGVPVNVDPYMYPVTREREKTYDFSARLSPAEAASVWSKNLIHSMGKEAAGKYAASVVKRIDEAKENKEEMPVFGTTCLAGNCSFTVNWQGMIRPCVMLDSPEISAFDPDFSASWDRLVSETALLRIPDKCKTCYLRTVCRICPANAVLETTEEGEEPEYLCRLAECIYDELKRM